MAPRAVSVPERSSSRSRRSHTAVPGTPHPEDQILGQAAGQISGQDAAAQLPPLPPTLPELKTLRSPRDLKDLTNVKLTETNFTEWKAYMMTEFSYYGIDKIINGSHLPPTSGRYHGYWIEIELLYEHHLVLNLLLNIYQMISQKISLKNK